MKNILVIGSVACDEIIRLKEPLRVGGHNQGYPETRRIGGGAANTALALAQTGDRIRVLSAVANDEDGKWLIAQLLQAGIDTSLIQNDAQAITRSLVFIEESGDRTIVNRCRAEVSLSDLQTFKEADVIYVRSADSALTPVLNECVYDSLVVAHIPPVIAEFRPAQILLGSRDDLDSTFVESPWQRGLEVAGSHLQWVVVTQGGDGAIAYGEDRVLSSAAPQVVSVDTTGAGDVFAAGLVHSLARGEPMEEALACGVKWGSASVCYEGTVPPVGFPDIR